jgi:membrane associated rhomboid family serine protease
VADVADRFSFSKPDRRGPHDPWFRVGQVEFGTAAVFASLCAVSLLIYGIEPVNKPFLTKLVLIPASVFDGEVWRIVTWPFANGFNDRLLWIAVTIALLWYFGGRLEAQAGRTRFGFFLAAVVILPGIVGTLLDLPQAGARPVQLVVLLVFIAEYPNLRFFFGIPAWALGLVYVLTDILQLTGTRAGEQLLFYMISLAIAAVSARSIGLLAAYPWIPGIPIGDGGRSRPARVPRPPRRPRSGRPTVVEGPWGVAAAVPSQTSLADQAELDSLLDKIAASGMDSLSGDEKRRLNDLSKKLRKR